MLLVECVDDGTLVTIDNDEVPEFTTSDNSPSGGSPSDSPDDTVEAFGPDNTMPRDTTDNTPYTVTITTSPGNDDQPMTLDVDTENVDTITITFNDDPNLSFIVRYFSLCI